MRTYNVVKFMCINRHHFGYLRSYVKFCVFFLYKLYYVGTYTARSEKPDKKLEIFLNTRAENIFPIGKIDFQFFIPNSIQSTEDKFPGSLSSNSTNFCIFAPFWLFFVLFLVFVWSCSLCYTIKIPERSFPKCMIFQIAYYIIYFVFVLKISFISQLISTIAD